MEKDIEISTEKQRPWFQKWKSGNPAWKPKWTQSFRTVFERAIKKIASEDPKSDMRNETEIVKKYLKEASQNPQILNSLLDRLYGKATQTIESDITSKWESISQKASDQFSKLLNNAKNDSE